MRILNLNIGIKIDNTDAVLELIKAERPDIATFQEVGNALEKSCFKMFDAKAAIEKDFKFCHFAPLYQAEKVTRNGDVLFEFGGKTEQGSLIVSNFEITKSENQFYYNEYKNYYDVTNFYESDWCRSLQNCILNVRGKPLQILNVHGIWNKDKIGNSLTHAQTDFILSQVRNDIPCILIGDFNLIPESEDIQKISAHLTNLSIQNGVVSTRPPFKTQQVVDYIFVNEKVKAKNFEVIKTTASDHYPLILDFELN